MTQYSKFNVVYRLQKWMDSVPGQTFLNYAYSWGASIVILGTLFKLTHLPGANFFLFLGMGTEVFVFFISAFDRPFDKTADGMDLVAHMASPNTSPNSIPEQGSPTRSLSEGGEGLRADGEDGMVLNPAVVGDTGSTVIGGAPVSSGPAVIGGGTIIFGGGGSAPVTPPLEGTGEASLEAVNTEGIAAVSQSVARMAGTAAGAGQQLPKMDPELEQATSDYVAELKRLTEMLSKVSEQSEKLGRNSEEMDNLDRTLTGICKVYEMQLKSASSQIGTIDEINEQTKKMAKQIEELNRIYTRMIEAMQAPLLSPQGGMMPKSGM